MTCREMSSGPSKIIERSGLDFVNPNKIRRNPQNPRMIFYEENMELLKTSIANVGILVPLIVYKSKKADVYYLLDGERRWRCALDLKLPSVPVNIFPEPDMEENLKMMFNIHNVRDDWELTPMALKLELLMRLSKETNDLKLSEMTGLKPSNIRRCKTLLSFDRHYLDMTLTDDSTDKLTGDFFVELYPVLTMIRKELPEIAAKHSQEQITDIMISKYRSKKITALTEFRKFRDLVRLVKKGISAKSVSNSVEELLRNPEMGINQTYENTAATFYGVQKIVRQSEKLNEALGELDFENVNKPDEFLNALRDLRLRIDSVLRRFSQSI